MEKEKVCLLRIVAGIVLWISNNKFTWNIINYFANTNSGVNVQLISLSRTVFVIISLIGLVIVVINSVILLKLTLFLKR
jgi:hypothetical protein